MEQLKYVIEDKTIAYLLGINNFTNDESAVLELVKNAYDAKALTVSLEFFKDGLVISDDGEGMNEFDIREHWMHVGKSNKKYEIEDANSIKRVLAGSKGVGRFALARLGEKVKVYSKKANTPAILWETDWNQSALSNDETNNVQGTKIVISELREKWGKKKIQELMGFLSKTYNDEAMRIVVNHPDYEGDIPKYFPVPKVGKNCLSTIHLTYSSKEKKLSTKIVSDEFLDEAKEYCPNINLKESFIQNNMVDEIDASKFDMSEEELQAYLEKLGDFSAQFYFYIKSSPADMDKFLYKYSGLPEALPGGVILYRNAFSISSYEGKKDWLGFGKRLRKSPAAATHPTGAWRVRENQIAGKVEIDKKRNEVLVDLSNRQGLEENIYFQLFVKIILIGINEFERYRQEIIRKINIKNKPEEKKMTPVSDKVVSNPKSIPKLSEKEAKQLVDEIKTYRKESKDAQKDKEETEERYKYDVRILNVLATAGLKASSIAHEMRNDRNAISTNTSHIIDALQTYGMWDELNSPEKTRKIYNNVPYLLESNNIVSNKIVAFMNVMLSEVEKKQFEISWKSVFDILKNIKSSWETDYAWVTIDIIMEEDVVFHISEDVIRVITDNLILNSIQQNEEINHLKISIEVKISGDYISFIYKDNGKGLDKKYVNSPRRILDVHETTRKNGHGLGMWIVNNTAIMSGGSVDKISGEKGFYIELTIGGAI